MWRFFTKDAAEKQQLATPPSVVNPVARVIVPTAVVTNGVWTFLAYSTEEIDTDNMVDLVAQSRRITIQHSGKYLISATTTWAANATGGRGVRFVKNGVILYDGSGMEGGSISGFGPSSSAIVDCVAGDYLEMQVYQSSGGTINLGVSTFQAVKVDGAVVTYVDVPKNFVGQEVAYNEFLSAIPISATTEAGSTSIIAAPSFTADGIASYMIDVFIPEVILAAAGGAGIVFSLWDNGVELGRMGAAQNVAATTGDIPVRMARRLTPTAGPHVYSLRGFSFGSGSSSVQAGNGGVGLDLPGFIRVTRAA